MRLSLLKYMRELMGENESADVFEGSILPDIEYHIAASRVRGGTKRARRFRRRAAGVHAHVGERLTEAVLHRGTRRRVEWLTCIAGQQRAHRRVADGTLQLDDILGSPSRCTPKPHAWASRCRAPQRRLNLSCLRRDRRHSIAPF
jgi:hypothetical protein